MEYGIYSNDNDANKAILDVLEDLNKLFFVEDSNSENEQEPDFAPDEDEEIVDFNDNIRLNRFEFVETPDSYIEDEVYDNLKLEIKNFFEKGKCSCRSKQPCFEKIGYERFLARRSEFEGIDKKMRDMVVKGQLMAFQKDKNTKKVSSDNRKYLRFNYSYNNDIPICRNTYQTLLGVSHKYLDTIIQHFREYGMDERVHGNTGRAPKNMKRIEVSYDVACDVYEFLKNYSNIHGMPSPGRNLNKATTPVVFLLTSYNYYTVYRDYVTAYKDKHGIEARVMNMKKKLEHTEKFLAHLNRAQQEREYYNANIKLAVEDGKRNLNKVGSQALFKTFEGIAHVGYDWAQNVQIPYSPQQIGSLFFKSPRKVHLFGVCNTGNFPHTQQINYVIDEAEMPDDGKQGKGVNCTLSLVWHAIQRYNCGEKKLIITCDNCVGQNKNSYSLFFYSWLIDRGMYDEIELNFMIPGHTKFICDGCFGLIKILYRKSKVNTVNDVVSIVNRSTTIQFNIAQRYLSGVGFQYYNFKNYFQINKKLPNIQKYYHFYFTSKFPGVVFYKNRIEDDYKQFTICTFPFNINTLPSTINVRQLSLKRQEELYKEIAPYVDLPFRDITCPKPQNESETN
ncbi:hypothetical protein RhiirA4_415139 [Rhizophagus irregularis]|uniref:DUF7869 domain-containing protein n=1 Tax=Rhizophagus irregularis TaxID=588596 RepID=A0A2I1FYW5_9GLOM|nr:hypothetical protein RhiirA4_415139 [Rhizophagus irregularis]